MNARSETAKLRGKSGTAAIPAKLRGKSGTAAIPARRRTRQYVEDAEREDARFYGRFVVAAVGS
jgi:hypothetical protein